ncbi:hypothetical protein CDL15_Pgr009267 [Punica granatum]|uniref:Uncharacterized protein n=1 Tax=Punica granatum TaxID=22663 RepID=A0A218VUW4_PUNGR|nr:hypothetical protein CDL15_Pgr009267 [Punica granatum]
MARAGMEIGGGADKACSEDKNAAGGRGTAVGAGGGGKGTWVDGIQGAGSIVGPCPGEGVELKDARFGPLSRANSSAMLVVMLTASWLTVPSSAAIRTWSSEVDDGSETRGRGAPEDVEGGRCIEGAPEYAGGTPAGVGGDGACVGGG